VRKTRLIVTMALALLAISPLAALATRYTVVPGEGTQVTFTSRAPMEKFDGRSGAVSGRLTVDPGRLAGETDLEVTVDLASFDTGLAKRNRHMRENHLETHRFPEARFSGGTITGARGQLVAGQQAVFTLTGILDLHGVKQRVTCEVTARDLGEGRLQVETRFPVRLSDHAIKRPKFLVMKLADEQQVHVRLLLQEVE